MTSNTKDEFSIMLPSLKPASLLKIWTGILMTNMSLQEELVKEKEIEIAKILHEFVIANAHLFSHPVLAAAKCLLEEIQKAEGQQCQTI